MDKVRPLDIRINGIKLEIPREISDAIIGHIGDRLAKTIIDHHEEFASKDDTFQEHQE